MTVGNLIWQVQKARRLERATTTAKYKGMKMAVTTIFFSTLVFSRQVSTAIIKNSLKYTQCMHQAGLQRAYIVARRTRSWVRIGARHECRRTSRKDELQCQKKGKDAHSIVDTHRSVVSNGRDKCCLMEMRIVWRKWLKDHQKYCNIWVGQRS